ncbi:MAG TPA: penicillin-binding protein 2 [Caldimonas sp.]|jgi:cell division protein FtsI (penicillin-binding protein 3)|nr:penicillin-binding protein 2 [Caldimonas sp.]HEX2539599.1 penicillin-binding protein 2 [Caldimonas sp.]
MSRKSSARPRVAASVRSVNYTTSPLLATPTPPWRSKMLVGLVGLGFAVLLGRAVYVQIVDAPFFLKQGEIRYGHTLGLPASRGRIVDRNGLVLAASVPAPSIWAIPKDLEGDARSRAKLASLLGMTSAELETRLRDNPNFVWLRRQVDEPVATAVKGLRIRGIHEVREYKRKYPEGEAAAHVVGFTNVEDRGQEGVELAFQSDLAGKDGTRRVIKDRLGRVIEDVGDSIAPVDGRDIGLTIDSKVQFFAYQRIRDAVAAHKAKAGSVVVLDAQSGEVLALANFPSYVPGDRKNLTGAQLRNRALTDTFEPGSTMKPFVAAWAMESGRVTPDTVIQTAPGRMQITGSTITDAHPHGNLTVRQVIQKSSNVGAVRMAMSFSSREMWELYSALGFGQKPQLGFPGVVSGRLRPHKTWRPIEQATMSYGYGLSASLFQIAHAYTVFAHDGELIPVTLTRPLGVVPTPRVTGVRVISPKTAAAVRDMLHLAALPGGTAPKAQVLGYSVGGKSGTAYKQEGTSYAQKKYRSWFVGMAPIANPRVIVAVMVDEPSAGKHFGGDVAAPVFSEVVQQTLRLLGVQPDLDVKPQIVSREMPAEEESF